jgi:hypothetical protein
MFIGPISSIFIGIPGNVFDFFGENDEDNFHIDIFGRV